MSGQVLAEGDLEPEECVIKIASLLRFVSASLGTGIYIEMFGYICKFELIF